MSPTHPYRAAKKTVKKAVAKIIKPKKVVFRQVKKQYTIDLTLPEKERWSHVIRAEWAPAHSLMLNSIRDLETIPKAARYLISKAYQAVGGLYVGEMKAWAESLDVPLSDFILVQCGYDLEHAGRKIPLMGCTSGIRNTANHGMVHIRSMDWSLEGAGRATRIFRFINEDREFLAVGMVGMIGVLSGMVPGAYSATINWAAPEGIPRFTALSPLFLLREILESCDTYEEAVYSLQKTPISTNVYFTVCGAKKGQACTIERGKDTASVRKFKDGTHSQSNHYQTRPFLKLNKSESLTEGDEGDQSLLESSSDRLITMLEQFNSGFSKLESYEQVLRKKPIRNDQTIHQMAFRPKTGDLCVWAVND